MAEPTEVYDLLILVDATYSMSSYLTSLQTSLPKIISISALTDSFSRVGLLAYRDYCDTDLLQWSGWMQQSKLGAAEGQDQSLSVDLLEAAKALYANGGGDYPEATKTGLARAYQEMREDATTIILLYTDAPPHTAANGNSHGYNNFAKEKKALQDPESYGGFGPAFVDWVHAGRTMALKEEGKKRAHVFSILEPSMSRADGNYYTFLSTLTGGACFYLDSSEPKDISKVTVDLLLAWMGVEKTGAEATKIAARLAKFKNRAGIEDVTKESTKESAKGSGNVEELSVDSAVLKNFMPKKKTPVQDFAQRYKADEAYKLLVAQHLQKIIDEDVSAISLNPVFGSLWRTVCNDRANENREALISSFGLQVDRIANADEKELMKNWLAESYDYSAEVQETIELVPEAQRFPCVYLDPTLAFVKPTGADTGGEDEDDRPIAAFRRDELLEIGRSCDYRILRRLGRVLTRLTFIDSAADLPAHIANAEEGKAQRIPMALASKEFGHRFWRILLHIVVPGTMLSARPAALLAALAIRLGIQPLLKAADTEMLMWRNKWNDLEVPETWNASCLGLLLDADKAYLDRKRLEKAENGKGVKGLLTATDKQLFDRLVSYKMLELNLKTTLTAKVGWKPEKTTMPIGPVVACRSCHYPRSVTMMGPKGTCGICLAADYNNDKERQEWIDGHVTKEDNETTNATWVECFIKTCRAQYIVYHPEALNVRPKCHYCRQQSSDGAKKRSNEPQPCLECEQCLSRVIFPKEYRTKDMGRFKCVACDSGRKTIIEVETTAQGVSKENETTWLLENKQDKLKEPLSGRSLFHQITNAGSQSFCDQVILFPNAEHQALTLDGKLIRNTPDLIVQLKTWVSRRRRELGTCSLCFSNFRKVDLNPACGRHGCEQRICRDCLGGWYGLNAAGRIINTAALSCPFCRRAPTAKTLHSYGLGIHAVGGLRDAVSNAGEWVYAWCARCANAKQYLERVCAAGAPTELNDWICSGCETELAEAADLELAMLQAEVARLELEDRRANYEQRAEAERAIAVARSLKAAKEYREMIKECPQCKVKTQKSSGCGHMTCICGTHWCWFCGEKSSPDNIYSHMQTEHGGWYAGGDEDMDEDYWNTSDED